MVVNIKFFSVYLLTTSNNTVLFILARTGARGEVKLRKQWVIRGRTSIQEEMLMKEVWALHEEAL